MAGLGGGTSRTAGGIPDADVVPAPITRAEAAAGRSPDGRGSEEEEQDAVTSTRGAAANTNTQKGPEHPRLHQPTRMPGSHGGGARSRGLARRRDSWRWRGGEAGLCPRSRPALPNPIIPTTVERAGSILPGRRSNDALSPWLPMSERDVIRDLDRQRPHE